MPGGDVTKSAGLRPSAFNMDLAQLMMRAPKYRLTASDSLTDGTCCDDQAATPRAIIGCCIFGEARDDSRNITLVEPQTIRRQDLANVFAFQKCCQLMGHKYLHPIHRYA